MLADPWYALPSDIRVGHLTVLATEALESWGGSKQAPELFLEGENAVFRAELLQHGTCAIRVHRAHYHTAEHLRSQVAWCRSLTADRVVDTPEVIDTTGGEPFILARHPEVPEPRYVSVLAWAPGDAFSDDDASSAETHHLLGRLLGSIHAHGRSWTGRDAFVGIRWDAAAFVGDDPLLGAFWRASLLDDDDRRIMEAFRREAQRALDDLGETPERFGIVHGDLLPQNLLVHDGNLTLLDFDDCGHGWYLMEIATALMAASFGPDYPALRDALLDGYRDHAVIDSADLDVLPLLIALRVASYVGWVETHPFTPAAIHRGAAITRRGVQVVADHLAGNGLPA